MPAIVSTVPEVTNHMKSPLTRAASPGPTETGCVPKPKPSRVRSAAGS